MSEEKTTNYEEMMKMYNESHQEKPTLAKKYDLKNYFSTHLNDSDKEGTKKIRLLPPSKGKTSSVDILWAHKIQVNDGSWKTYPCLEHEEGKPCPLCEARQALYASGKESDKELAKKYSARKMYILKLIERGKESEGVKFWRFNHAYDKNGTLDKIMKAMKAVEHDVTDPSTGRDLNIEVARNQWNTPVVQSVTYPLNSTTLTDDAEQSKLWLEDVRTWRDVYSERDYNYLAIIVKGHTPEFDKDKDMFVSKEDKAKAEAEVKATMDNVSEDDSELTMGDALNTEPVSEPVAEPVTEPVTQSADEDDDLPF